MPPEDEEDLWADSADRKVAIRALDEHRTEEHLTDAEHERRRDLVKQARTRGELLALFADLPAPRPLIGESAAARGVNGPVLLLSTGGIIVLLALAAGWWVPALIFACLLVVATVLTTAGHR